MLQYQTSTGSQLSGTQNNRRIIIASKNDNSEDVDAADCGTVLTLQEKEV